MICSIDSGQVQSRQRWSGVATLLGLAAIAIGSCSIDPADACGEHQVHAASDTFAVCICDEANGYVLDKAGGQGCKQCDEGLLAQHGSCVEPNATADAGTDEDSGADEPDGPPAPTGLGAPCGSNDDCAAFDATFCDPSAGVCLVENCASGDNLCPTDHVCCDYDALLEGLSICVDTGRLAADACPMGGKRVSP